MMKYLVSLAVFAISFPTLADETAITLKDASGRETVLNNCGACHSLDYIPMNSPFLNRAGWDAEVGKMIKVFGAPIDAGDAKTIIDYLTKSYGIDGPS